MKQMQKWTQQQRKSAASNASCHLLSLAFYHFSLPKWITNILLSKPKQQHWLKIPVTADNHNFLWFHTHPYTHPWVHQIIQNEIYYRAVLSFLPHLAKPRDSLLIAANHAHLLLQPLIKQKMCSSIKTLKNMTEAFQQDITLWNTKYSNETICATWLKLK